MTFNGLNSVVFPLAFLFIFVGGAAPQAQTVSRDSLQITMSEAPPVIDGKLDEAAWQNAAVLKDFIQTQPGDNIKATHPTEVRLGYDKKFLYIGIHAFDERGQVRSTIAKRDDLSGNDYTAIWLDTYNDNRRAYVLLFNPLGIQADAIFTEGQTLDYSVDVVMESKGVLTEDGYTVEVAVPFSSLRYQAGKDKLWGVHVLRKVGHLDEWDSWKPLRRESRDFSTATFTRFLEQAGRITGLDKIGGERTLELIPTLTLSETGRRVRTIPYAVAVANPNLLDPGRFINEAIKPELGLTAKFTLTSGVTLNAAINPDFAQVEADELVVTANQRFPIFFEEKRPFFLEGIENFQTPIRALHTRTIIDPDLAVKLTGKRGKETFGLMLASDNAPGQYSEEEQNDPVIGPGIKKFVGKNALIGALRFKHDVGKESSIGIVATSYNFIEKHNQLFGIDGRFALDTKTTLTFQAIGTTSRRFFYSPTQDAEIYRTGNGFAYYFQTQRNTRHLNLSVTGRGYSPDFRADAGFISQTNTNPWDFIATYNSKQKQDSMLISWSLSNGIRTQFDWKARMTYAFEVVRSTFNFKRQTYLKADVYTDYLRLFEEEFGAKRTLTHPGAFFGGPERSALYKGFTLEAGTAPTKRYSLTIVYDRTWRALDYDFGAGPKFPRVSPAALADENAPLDPGKGTTLDMTASLKYRPTNALNFSLNYIKSRLVRGDTGRVAFDQNLYSLKTIYQFSRFTFARVRIDYDTLQARVLGQFLAGWTPNPGTALYVGYNDDLNHNGFNPFTGQHEPGLQRNTRTFFIKMSYLFRRSF
jgi:hypothetical protein